MTDKITEEKFTNEMIEEHIRRAVSDSVPDMLEDLMKEIGAEKQEFTPVTAAAPGRRRWTNWYKAIAGCAAAVLVFVGAFSLFGRDRSAFAVIGLDVNPSVEISIDRNERVISAEPLNEDGEAILDGMDLEGADVNVACNALVGSMLTKGYLTEDQNSLLLSVRAKDEARGREIEQKVAGNLNAYFTDSKVHAAIRGQYVEEDEALIAFAAAHDISIGKAWLIRSLLAAGDGRLTEESLLGLSTQELLLLSQEKDIPSETSYGRTDTSKYIARERAMEIALGNAGLTSSQVTGLNAEFDCENGAIVYEVEFRANGREYEYDVDAVSGKIVRSESDRDDTGVDDDDDRYDRDDDDDDDRYDRDDDDDDRYDRDDDDDDDDD